MWVVVETWGFSVWGPFDTPAKAAAFARKKGREYTGTSAYWTVHKVRGV